LPTTDAERVIFRQLYETLVRMDCRGEVHPGLAESWESSEGGRVWTFRLRPNARFSDGSHLRAEDVRAGWESASRSSAGGEHPVYTWVHPDSLRTRGTDEVIVALVASMRDLPVVFAHPGLSVTRAKSLGGWPLGSGPYRTRARKGDPHLYLSPNPYHPRPGNAEIRLVLEPKTDVRDLLGRADMVIVRDREMGEYAARLPGFTTIPLPWDRIYCLFSPFLPGSPAAKLIQGDAGPSPMEPGSVLQVREQLAGDVMRGDSRPAVFLSFSEDTPPGCPEPVPTVRVDTRIRQFTPAQRNGEDPPKLLCRVGDPESRRLAERLVALAGDYRDRRDELASPLPILPQGMLPPVVLPSPSPDFRNAIHRGWAWGCVAPVSRDFADPCLDAQALFSSFDWLWCAAGGCDAPGDESQDAGSRIRFERGAMPLVASRPLLIARDGLTGFSLDGNGTLLLRGAGWKEDQGVP
jgi:hypothetical protein